MIASGAFGRARTGTLARFAPMHLVGGEGVSFEFLSGRRQDRARFRRCAISGHLGRQHRRSRSPSRSGLNKAQHAHAAPLDRAGYHPDPASQGSRAPHAGAGPSPAVVAEEVCLHSEIGAAGQDSPERRDFRLRAGLSEDGYARRVQCGSARDLGSALGTLRYLRAAWMCGRSPDLQDGVDGL
jgi:hypothetical protein